MTSPASTLGPAVASYGHHADPALDLPVLSRLRFFDGPLQLTWQHCGSTAEFISLIFADQAKRTGADFNETRHSISYLANELLENVVKFRAPGGVTVEVRQDRSTFLLTIANRIAEPTSHKFQALLAELTARDPGELLIERIEANAIDPSSGSGLGILTLMSDYNARLGWTFEQAGPGHDVSLNTQAQLSLT